jgi:ferrous iron transport protein A
MKEMILMMPLAFLKGGDKAMVVRVSGSDDVKKHLEDLGFTAGSVIQVISAPGKGSLIVSCHDTRLAVTAEMAQKIFVTFDAE